MASNYTWKLYLISENVSFTCLPWAIVMSQTWWWWNCRKLNLDFLFFFFNIIFFLYPLKKAEIECIDLFFLNLKHYLSFLSLLLLFFLYPYFCRLESILSLLVCQKSWRRVSCGQLFCWWLWLRVRSCRWTVRQVSSPFSSNWESSDTKARYISTEDCCSYFFPLPNVSLWFLTLFLFPFCNLKCVDFLC